MDSLKRQALACALLLVGCVTAASNDPNHLLLRQNKESRQVSALKRPVARKLLQSTALDNGARLSAAFTNPEGGAEFELNEFCSRDLSIDMEGSVGLGEPDVTYIFIIDESGSTESILPGIKAFFTDLVDVLFDDGSALNIGSVLFDSSTTSLGLKYESDAQVIKNFIATASSFGGTDCAAGLEAARILIAASGADVGSKTIVIFAGDGECSEGDASTATAVANLLASASTDVLIEVAAIGSGVTCGGLAEISSSCQDVDSVDDYNIEKVIGTKLTSIEFSGDGGSSYVPTTPTSGCTFPDEEGPVFCEASPTNDVTIGLGANRVCVKASGTAATDPTIEDVEECMSLYGFDVTSPSFACPPNVQQGTSLENGGECYASVDLPDHMDPADTCGAPLTETKEPSGPIFVLGDTDVTYGLTDSSGNPATSCDIKVTVVDDEDPDVDCPQDYTIETDPAVCVADEPCVPKAIATDNCEVTSLTSDAPSVFTLGNTAVTWTADDDAGNDDECTFTVTLIDNEKPSVSCSPGTNPSGKEKPNGVDSHGFYVINADDNCDDVTIQLQDSDDPPWVYTVPGGFSDGVNIKYTASSSEQEISEGPGAVDWKIHGRGDLMVVATDGSGNENVAVCIVPPRK